MIVLGLGTNIGERALNLSQALHRLNKQYGIDIKAVSSIYETAPFGVTDQADFLNMVVLVETDLSPQELLQACLSVEQTMGRVRTRRWGPRVIDIDVLLYDDMILDTPELILPHPGILQRGFVIIPLRDIIPELILPDGRSVAAVAADFAGDGSEVRFWKSAQWDTGSHCLVS
jgi:2-amino-4-hydroxy-6-hydroxymethyldihydropteridine diphosphokinase